MYLQSQKHEVSLWFFFNFQTQPDKSCDVQDCTSELDIS